MGSGCDGLIPTEKVEQFAQSGGLACMGLDLGQPSVGHRVLKPAVKQTDALRCWAGELVAVCPAVKLEPAHFKKYLLLQVFLQNLWRQKPLGFALHNVQRRFTIEFDQHIRDTPSWTT